MSEISVTELRQNLPICLAKVQRGERIRVMSRGKVVAELAPPASPPASQPVLPPAIVAAARTRLLGSVRYDHPLESVVDASEWDMNR